MSKRSAPWTPSWRVVAWLAATLAALLAAYWAFQPDRTSNGEAPQLTHLSASGLFDRYRDNHAATQLNYGEHRLAVTGTIDSVDLGKNELTITFQHDRGSFVAASAIVHRLSWPEASRLKPGMKATVRCDRADWFGDGPALLRACQL
jgi:hypothetical protein